MRSHSGPPVSPAPGSLSEVQTESVGPDAVDSAPPRSGATSLQALWRRRHFLVDRKSQLRACLLATATAMVLLALLNISLYSTRAQATAAILGESPELTQILTVQNRTESSLVILASMVFLAGVFAVTMLETHKTAGAALHVSRKLQMIVEGRYGVRLVLRRDDNLREVEKAFNTMSRALLDRALRQTEELEALAGEAERLAAAAQGPLLAQRLRDLARRSRPIDV